jgi:hypothetical protein
LAELDGTQVSNLQANNPQTKLLFIGVQDYMEKALHFAVRLGLGDLATENAAWSAVRDGETVVPASRVYIRLRSALHPSPVRDLVLPTPLALPVSAGASLEDAGAVASGTPSTACAAFDDAGPDMGHDTAEAFASTGQDGPPSLADEANSTVGHVGRPAPAGLEAVSSLASLGWDRPASHPDEDEGEGVDALFRAPEATTDLQPNLRHDSRPPECTFGQETHHASG